MKKIMIIGIVFLLTLTYAVAKSNEVIIPGEAIRFRVIANSDSDSDQNTKILVRDTLEKQISLDLKNITNIKDSRKILTGNLDNYKNLIINTLEDNNIEETFKINYGFNYFPEKKYKGVKYKEGKYESLVVTLGKGEGKNWWCVLFPPLCLLEAEENYDKDEIEYKSYVKELIDKFFK